MHEQLPRFGCGGTRAVDVGGKVAQSQPPYYDTSKSCTCTKRAACKQAAESSNDPFSPQFRCSGLDEKSSQQ
jgi:hypothetical protein